MSLRGKSRYFIATVMILMIFIVNCKLIYSDNIYPLEVGEKLIEEAIIDENYVEIFTQLDEEFYLKKLQKNDGKWVVESVETLKPRWTGLEIGKTEAKGDRKLAAALENELQSYGLDPASLPVSIDYFQSKFLPPVGDQGLLSSCVGWAAGYYLRTYQQARDIGWEVKGLGGGIASHIFSPSFIYNQINKNEDDGPPVDDGATIEGAGRLLMNTGAATLEDFPYIEGDYFTQPSPEVIQSAYPHRIRKSVLLYSDSDPNQYIIDETKKYLNTGDLVVAGSRVGLKFMHPYYDTYGNSIVTREYYPSSLHAYVIVGYNDAFITPDGVGAFKVVSSWGREWGNDGFSYVSYDAFTANVVEGYVFTDLVNSEPQELVTDINDVVTFNMNFSGTGRFDIKIKNSSDQLIYEENNLQGQPGLNTHTWDGKDMAENSVDDGSYKLSIIPYKGDTPKPAFDTIFNKLSKAESARTLAYSNNYGVQYVDIPITFKSDGMMSIKVACNGTVHELVSNQAVKAGESNTYTIFKSDFDFNNIDLNQVKIVIDIS